jgi:secretion/DNA translocation related CpaE-like protein
MTISTVAVCCDDLGLMTDARRLCATAGLDVEVTDTDDPRRWWTAAAAVLVDAAAAGQLAGRGLPRRARVVLLSRTDDPAAWRLAVVLGAEQVAVLPTDEAVVLQSVLSARARSSGAPVVACVPATGGAGASTVAVGLALAAARTGIETLLVDADAAGGGLDLLLGLEHAAGLRWADVRAMGRDTAWASILDDLVRPAPGLRLLSWGRGDEGDDQSHTGWPPADIGVDVGLVLLDLPRQMPVDPAPSADVALLVTRAGVRQTMAAARMASRLRSAVDDVRLVVRGSTRHGLSAEEIAAAINVPLAADLPEDKRMSVAADEGGLARVLARMPFDALVAGLVHQPGRAA